MKRRLILAAFFLFLAWSLIVLGLALSLSAERSFKAAGKTGFPNLRKGPGSLSSGCACWGSKVSGPSAPSKSRGKAKVKEGYQEAVIKVNNGYQPQILEVKAGLPLRLTFTQGSSSCDSVVVLPFAGLKIDVSSASRTVEIPPLKPGIYDYFCGMNMLKGRIEVK